jgi:hypothetical protein
MNQRTKGALEEAIVSLIPWPLQPTVRARMGELIDAVLAEAASVPERTK